MTTNFIGTYDWATSNTWTPTEEDRIHLGNDISGTLLASGNHNAIIVEREENMTEVNQIGNLFPSENRSNPNQGRLYDKDGLSPTLSTMEGGNRQPFIVEDKVTGVAMRGRDDGKQHIECNGEEVANALTTVQKDSMINKGLRIRKLTPKECWRLQGFDDEDFDKAASVNSNAQLYKQAGNSIAVPCLTGILTNLFSVDREKK